ncbi:hypothetical protein [Archangium sp.]|uniref:hypothetical protein n=1 Tax=Archangium sp. TaxID=1872627 RepID=UPI002D5F5B56|nr:hypothetical protein [Archangium sp.]HYO59458.1 hypothetical protein [Archangium sp.]
MLVPEETWATVSGVKAGDVLRVREVPDWRSLEVATLAPGTRCVREVHRPRHGGEHDGPLTRP